MGAEGEGAVEEATGFEVCIVLPKLSRAAATGPTEDCVARLVRELEGAGLLVERVRGVPAEFIKLAAPMGTLGRAAADMQMKKLTYIGMELQFQWDQVAAFVRQPDGSLFSWRERYCCFRYLIYGIVNKTNSEIAIKFDGKEFHWKQSESLLTMLEAEGVVKRIFPLHDEIKRKQLLRNWALNWLDFTWQPIDEIYSYFGTKIATYFAFLGMYTRWLFFPAVFGLTTQLIDFGSLQWLVLPAFFIFVISWAVFFLQFWKRKNSALLARWGINCSLSEYKNLGIELSSLSDSLTVEEKKFCDVSAEKSKLQRNEWFGVLLRIRNNAIIVLAIICLQLPFELAYAHLYEITETEAMKYLLTAVYLVAIQYYTRIGGKVSVNLIKYENNQGEESSSASLVYKVNTMKSLVFTLCSHILGYFTMLHCIVIYWPSAKSSSSVSLCPRHVLENLIENSIPYLKYSYKKYIAVHKKKHEKESPVGRSVRLSTRVEKEYLKPSYTASIGAELEDGLFDDFLELALQFGMIMMFACAFPLIFCFAALNNVTEIRADALKLLVMLKRPEPRAAATIGAWLNIFQFLVVMAICTNCLLLVCLYDEEGKWRIEPGLAAILIMEHALLLIKFGFSHFVPEEPAWVKANRVRYVAQAQNVCSKQLLRSISKFDGKLD
ncbi:Anoctamin-like protein [Zea mays]|uniref:Anoctamin-like protein n=1 Tax=Zea mays TaxID=4577 RepID=A0A1D6NEF2_MAIZE|nr:Anoctamin-like protein [Zea mays]ONM38872.1 Anoctamin-like protein [Zea mays]